MSQVWNLMEQLHTHTYTHNHIYIYTLYIYICIYLCRTYHHTVSASVTTLRILMDFRGRLSRSISECFNHFRVRIRWGDQDGMKIILITLITYRYIRIQYTHAYIYTYGIYTWFEQIYREICVYLYIYLVFWLASILGYFSFVMQILGAVPLIRDGSSET